MEGVALDAAVPRLEGFVGRKAELARLRQCADAARASKPQLVLILGEPGIGKSALLRRHIVELDDFQLLRAACDATEADAAYGVISQLVARITPAEAKTFPLFSEPLPETAAPFQVGAQLLGVLGHLQNDSPLAIVIDDLQWADSESIQALGFALRRLWADRVLVILSARSGTPGHGHDPELWQRLASGPEHTRFLLRGLDRDEVAQLAGESGGDPFNPVTVDRIHQRTGGHPLYVRTVLADVSATTQHLPGPADTLPVPHVLSDVVQQQLGRLPEPSQRLAEAMAVLDQRSPLVMAGAVAGVKDPVEVLEPLLSLGLAQWWPSEMDTPVQTYHQMQRDAIYERIAPKRRRNLHLKAAELAQGAAKWRHLVAAADGVDERLAAELEEQAERASATGNVQSASTYLLWASGLSASEADRERRVAMSAACLLWGFAPGRAKPLRPTVEACSPSPLRDCVLGRYAMNRGQFAESKQLMTSAFHESDGTASLERVALLAASGLGIVHLWQGHGEDIFKVAQRVLTSDRIDPLADLEARLALGFGYLFTQGPHEAAAQITHIMNLPQDPGDAAPSHAPALMWRGVWRTLAGELRGGSRDLSVALRLAREHAVSMLDEKGHAYLATAQYLMGLWDDALINAANGVTIALHEERSWAYCQTHMAASLVASGRGEWKRAREHIRQSERWWEACGPAEYVVWPALSTATLAQAETDYPGMLRALQPVLDLPEHGWRSALESWWRPLHAEALIGSGRLDEAEHALHRIRELTSQTPYLHLISSGLSGWYAHKRGDFDAARASFEEGLSPSVQEDALMHRAFLEHALGRLLMDTKSQDDAVNYLSSARDRYATVRARRFVERCEADLAHCGSWSDDGAQDILASLTQRERHVARLVGKGWTNQEVARELYVSSKTIEYHLSNVFAKLQLTSRRQLMRLLTP
ncbi:AAA family ATPase [Streptomyces sp. R11]|uniref:AAA family ATPase n=1 Tax=Streptomyces sp. R11 TaxID=3238625 RepID=A0AB39NEV4_9ACTN